MMIKILSFTLLLLLSACLKVPDTEIQKGPEVDCKALDQQMSKMQTVSVLNIKKSEFAYIESTARIENLAPELSQQYAVTIMDRKEDAEIIELTIREEIREKVQGQFKSSVKEGPAYIRKQAATATQAAQSDSTSSSLGIKEVAQKLRIMAGSAADGQGAYCKTQKSGGVKSYHNLEVSDFDAPVPAAVRARPDCSGLKNCDGPLKAKLLKFDRWIQDPNDGAKEMKVTTYVTTVPEAPFFATIFSQCVQYSWPVETRQVLVTSCDDVKDFKFGTN